MKSFSKMTSIEREASYVMPKARTIPVLKIVPAAIIPNTTSLAAYGSSIGSTIGLKLSAPIRASLFLTAVLEQILVGILLGDASIRTPRINGHPGIAHVQGFIHLEYVL